jgi:hypothetical protein
MKKHLRLLAWLLSLTMLCELQRLRNRTWEK